MASQRLMRHEFHLRRPVRFVTPVNRSEYYPMPAVR